MTCAFYNETPKSGRETKKKEISPLFIGIQTVHGIKIMMPRIENSREPNTKKYISRVYPQFIFWSEPILLLRAFNYENDVLPIVLIQPTLHNKA